MFQHTAARRRLDVFTIIPKIAHTYVSTHSRPKAAGGSIELELMDEYGFNTQPPEGGWPLPFDAEIDIEVVSTHSRPKAAGAEPASTSLIPSVSTHSRPKAAGAPPPRPPDEAEVSTHSRPKAAGPAEPPPEPLPLVSTHSRPKAAGQRAIKFFISRFCFNTQPPEGGWHRF